MRNQDLSGLILQILKDFYGFSQATVSEQKGGWSARAFQIKTPDHHYFLKVYDKLENSTVQWTANLSVYLPFLQNIPDPELRRCVPKPLPCRNGSLWGETAHYLFLLSDYICGSTIGTCPLTPVQAAELGRITGRLHSLPAALIPAVQQISIQEDFQVPFCQNLQKLLNNSEQIPGETGDILRFYHPSLLRLCQSLEKSAKNLCTTFIPLCLCHTDIHGFNLMQADRLMLIDWEGLRIAPMEADLFALVSLPHFTAFWQEYRKIRPEAKISPDILKFYQLRRKCEDIWEFAARVLFDTLDEKTSRASLDGLRQECAHLGKMTF